MVSGSQTHKRPKIQRLERAGLIQCQSGLKAVQFLCIFFLFSFYTFMSTATKSKPLIAIINTRDSDVNFGENIIYILA